jgi:predicted metal-dependent phosphoesterase TrpH
MNKNNIIFSVPDISKLRNQGYLCVDMHFHTNFSDGASTVDQVLNKINKLDIGVAITDHNEIKGSQEAIRKKQEWILIIPGIEVKSIELIDILFYFYDEKEMISFYNKEIQPNKVKYLHSTKTSLPLVELVKLEKKYNCLMSVAHPYGYSVRSRFNDVFEKNASIIEHCKFIEALNGGNDRKHNELAVDYIIKNSKGYTGGSDGHSIFPLGNIITVSKARNLKEFLDNIKSKRNLVIGNENMLGKIGEYGRYAVNIAKNVFSK